MLTESQARALAKKNGYSIKKSRGGYSGDDLGGYMIVNANTNFVEAGERFNMSLEDVERFLKE